MTLRWSLNLDSNITILLCIIFTLFIMFPAVHFSTEHKHSNFKVLPRRASLSVHLK